MNYSIESIIHAVQPVTVHRGQEHSPDIRFISADTRLITSPEETLFFALKGDLHDGHDHIPAAFLSGVRYFVVDTKYTIPPSGADACYLFTDNVLASMQKLAASHRASFPELKVIGITGSNGKTTIKEWLGAMMDKERVIRSPKSFNSQTGVALSLWLIGPQHQTGIFEAGISQKGEMEKLAAMIKPEIGIFTNIGDAHASGFTSLEEKVNEKLTLFASAKYLIYEEDDILISDRIRLVYPNVQRISWGKSGLYLRVERIEKEGHMARLFLEKDRLPFDINVPFGDDASIQNVLHCITLLLFLGYSVKEIQDRVAVLHNLSMRLELKPGENQNVIINDTYNADLQSFDAALEFLAQHALGREKVVFLSWFDQSGKEPEVFAKIASTLLTEAGVQKVFAIGHELAPIRNYLEGRTNVVCFSDTNEAIAALPGLGLSHAAILVKGSRRFALDRLADALAQKWHEAVMETDLMAVGHNLRYFSSWLGDDTGIIAVIKASAYGSGGHELAAFLEYSKVDYLAVAYVDEGIDLRKSGITTPIMVLNLSAEQWPECVTWDLEPEVYSLEFLRKLWAIDNTRILKIHLKLDTGMNRLGLLPEDIKEACDIITQWSGTIEIATMFTHLASSEDEKDDPFTHHQVALFEKMAGEIETVLSYAPKRHVLNTAGIRRFPKYHFDYVRIGLGLYGVDVTRSFSGFLEKVHSLKARVIQLKNVYQGHTVGYNRRGKIGMHGKVAIVNIGYADGLMRQAGNERYQVWIKDDFFPIIGNVNMDLTIVYIGERDDIQVGDEVEIFGKNASIETLADACQTIPYEILTRVAPRVKRLYFKS